MEKNIDRFWFISNYIHDIYSILAILYNKKMQPQKARINYINRISPEKTPRSHSL